MSLRHQMRYLNPYDLHKLLINEYVLKKPEDSSKLFKRDTSKDKTDYDVLKDNHKFLWDEKDSADTWERQFAKKYYDKLFKEYCIADLALYKENKPFKIALRWRIEQEVVIGKGQFICGNKRCTQKDNLRSWEVNFGYVEKCEKKNALVKIRLCPDCSKKLNYHSKKREVKRLQRKKSKVRKGDKKKSKEASTSKPQEVEASESELEEESTEKSGGTSSNPWENQKPIESKSREEEMEDYLQELLL